MSAKKYASKEPGLSFSRGDLISEIQKELGTQKKRIQFPDSGIEIKNPKIQKAIEESKAFKNGAIFQLPTAAEIAAKKLRENQKAFREKMAVVFEGGFLTFDEKDNDKLRDFCSKAGINTKDKSKAELSGVTLVNRIKKTLALVAKDLEKAESEK